MDNQEIPNDDDYKFNPDILDKTIIAIPLLKEIEENPGKKIAVIIDLNLNYKGGRAEARLKIMALLAELMAEDSDDLKKARLTEQYVFTKIPANLIKTLIKSDDPANRAIFKIWPDFKIQPQTTKSVSTIKADAARSSFAALGEEITWAVVDSGINFSHPHFLAHNNKSADYHMDFTGNESPFEDEFGHGTHVAGIIAGELIVSDSKASSNIFAVSKSRDEDNNPIFSKVKLDKISGMAPKCKLVSLKLRRGKCQFTYCGHRACPGSEQLWQGHQNSWRQFKSGL